jgi:hypothetical protein
MLTRSTIEAGALATALRQDLSGLGFHGSVMLFSEGT